MPSREFVAALEYFPKDLAVPGDSFEDVRRKFAPAHGHDPGPDIAVEPATVGGASGVWVAKKGEPPSESTLFFVHGGAFVSCPASTYTFYAAWFVRATSGGLEWGVDVFEGALAGLVLAERKFESEAALHAAAPPAFAAVEVTDDLAFTGGALASAAPAAVLAWAAELIQRAEGHGAHHR